MARKKISEFKAKKLVNELLGLEYRGVSVGPEEGFSTDRISVNVQRLASSSEEQLYVVKVDQGVKKRGKQGLVKVGIKNNELGITIDELKQKGFEHFIIEKFVPHESSDEKYLALSRTREGIEAYYSDRGGVDIEENSDSIKKFVFPYTEQNSEKSQKQFADMQETLGLHWETIQKILFAFEKYYFSFLEINPLLVQKDAITLLDLAVEVDNAAEFFVKEVWTQKDFREYSKNAKTPEEKNVVALGETSQASFSLTVLNPDGAIWMLLSGGGASIVLADEAYNQGRGREVGNYGEYSGNPNEEETYYYTQQVLSLLLSSSAPKKVLIVGGGVANFTDVKRTFKGVIRAIDEVADSLRTNNVKVFVRRGGPNQEGGLKMMKTFLEEKDLYGLVAGPDLVLTDVMAAALKMLE